MSYPPKLSLEQKRTIHCKTKASVKMLQRVISSMETAWIAFMNIISIISIIPSHLAEDEAGRCRTAVGSLKSTAPWVSASIHLQQENKLLIHFSPPGRTGATSRTHTPTTTPSEGSQRGLLVIKVTVRVKCTVKAFHSLITCINHHFVQQSETCS